MERDSDFGPQIEIYILIYLLFQCHKKKNLKVQSTHIQGIIRMVILNIFSNNITEILSSDKIDTQKLEKIQL